MTISAGVPVATHKPPRCLCWLGVFADKALFSRPCCMHSEAGLRAGSSQAIHKPETRSTMLCHKPFGQTGLLIKEQFCDEYSYFFPFVICCVAHVAPWIIANGKSLPRLMFEMRPWPWALFSVKILRLLFSPLKHSCLAVMGSLCLAVLFMEECSV